MDVVRTVPVPLVLSNNPLNESPASKLVNTLRLTIPPLPTLKDSLTKLANMPLRVLEIVTVPWDAETIWAMYIRRALPVGKEPQVIPLSMAVKVSNDIE